MRDGRSAKMTIPEHNDQDGREVANHYRTRGADSLNGGVGGVASPWEVEEAEHGEPGDRYERDAGEALPVEDDRQGHHERQAGGHRYQGGRRRSDLRKRAGREHVVDRPEQRGGGAQQDSGGHELGFQLLHGIRLPFRNRASDAQGHPRSGFGAAPREVCAGAIRLPEATDLSRSVSLTASPWSPSIVTAPLRAPSHRTARGNVGSDAFPASVPLHQTPVAGTGSIRID